MSKSKFISITFYLCALLLVLIAIDVCVGSSNIFKLEASNSLFETILYQIRLPKTITCVLAGSGLALCGLLMQTLFRNPLAGPYALGVSSGASLFVAIATMLITSIQLFDVYLLGKSIITVFSMLGAFFVTSIILFISKKNKSNIVILLVGLMLAQVLGAFQSLIEYLSSADSLKTFIMWSMGNVSNTTLSDLSYMLPFFVIAVCWSYFLIKPLNAILLNEEYAQNLGVNVSKLRVSIIIITTLLVGVITAFCGPIAFVGISVPIASRLFFKTSHHAHQITFCLLLGAVVLLLADVICQIISSELVMPINTVTTLLGAPIVMYLLFKSKLNIS